jgi:DNA replication protein DnaC
VLRLPSSKTCDRGGRRTEGHRRKLRNYGKADWLFIHEVGYLTFDDKTVDILYEMINRRYERKSVIVTTNRVFKEWNEVFPNATCIATLLDRLLVHAITPK